MMPKLQFRRAMAVWIFILGCCLGPSLPTQAQSALPAPSLTGATAWLNSPPLRLPALRGKVVLVDFWTYSCINCLRSLPYVKAWYQRYRNQGLVVIGVHTPEFGFEHKLPNIKAAIKRFAIDYPVAVDNNNAIWNAFGNQYWPAHYLVDAHGRVRYHHYGEGGYAHSEELIRSLLQEAGAKQLARDTKQRAGQGIEQAAAMDELDSPETYLGYARAERFASQPPQVYDDYTVYTVPRSLILNQWALQGKWRIEAQRTTLGVAGGQLIYRFHARDLHLVLSPPRGGKARFKVSIDGHPPGADHGVDVAPDGSGTIDGQRLYQLIRQHGAVRTHTFRIEFLNSNTSAYAFTFG